MSAVPTTGALVRVRLFAGAAAAAGVQEELVDVVAEGGSEVTVADLRRELERRHPALAPVLEVSSVLVGEVASGPSTRLPPSDADGAPACVDVLPPFAGG